MGYSLERIRSEGLPLALGYLLPVVASKATMTYGCMARLLARDLGIDGRIFSTHVGGVVGSLMDRLHDRDPKLPLINVLVVNGATGSPGQGVDGYLSRRFGGNAIALTANRKVKLVSMAAREVYRHRQWPEVFRRTFGVDAPVADALDAFGGVERDANFPAPMRGGEAESREHKTLKAYVLAHPECVGIEGRPDSGADELLLLSGDEVDVCFETGKRIDLIEVKSSRSDFRDLQRGVYQCVKYRAVFAAQRRGVTADMLIVTTLVTEVEPPPGIKELARLNGVRLRVIPEKRRGRRALG